MRVRLALSCVQPSCCDSVPHPLGCRILHAQNQFWGPAHGHQSLTNSTHAPFLIVTKELMRETTYDSPSLPSSRWQLSIAPNPRIPLPLHPWSYTFLRQPLFSSLTLHLHEMVAAARGVKAKLSVARSARNVARVRCISYLEECRSCIA
jgi:hypothetical protein